MNKEVLEKYEPTIGIECHVQLNTKSKLFARVSNDAKEAEPNTTVSPICFGLPGVLPYLNQAAVDLAVKAGSALNAEINHFSKFDRKHYFYPDLPKGYQITQYDQPIIGEGYVEVPLGDKTVKIGIERAHLEEDAGKLSHPGNADYSLVDLNRAGTPLLEIVSKPDIKSPAAAKAYARELYLLMKYSGVSDVDMYYGHMRFDVNISVSEKGSSKLGTRAEVKNLNSFRAVEKAARFEFERQAELLNKGEQVVQETRGWHDDKQKTFSQRSKEEAHDYRYFPEPDLPPVELSPKAVDKIKSSLPDMPYKFRARLKALDLPGSVVELMVENPDNASIFSGEAQDQKDKASFMAKLISGPIQSLKNKNLDTDKITIEHMQSLFELRQADKISSNGVDSILSALAEGAEGTVESIADERSLLQESDSSHLEELVKKAIADNPGAVHDYESGETKALGFLTGQVMKMSKGRANPNIVKKLLHERLEN